MYEDNVQEGMNVISDSAVIGEIKKIIGSGQFCSLLAIKKDGSLRAYNLHLTPNEVRKTVQGTGVYDPNNYNLIRWWDRNAHRKMKSPETGEYRDVIGGWVSVVADGMIYFRSKGRNVIYDFTEKNADKISRVDQSLLKAMVKQMGIFNDNLPIIKVT
jgi:hypothetical protein